MNLARAVHFIGLFTGRKMHSFALNCCVIALLSVSLTSCAHQNQVEYLYLNNEVEDTAWGFRGSEARMEVTERVAVSASSMVDGETGMLLTEVTISNASTDYMRLLYRGCPVQIQIFEDEERESKPVFDSFSGSEEDCERREVVRTLFALEDVDIMEMTHMDQLISEELPEGNYYVSAVVRPNGVPVTVPAGEVYLEDSGAGS